MRRPSTSLHKVCLLSEKSQPRAPSWSRSRIVTEARTDNFTWQRLLHSPQLGRGGNMKYKTQNTQNKQEASCTAIRKSLLSITLTAKRSECTYFLQKYASFAVKWCRIWTEPWCPSKMQRFNIPKHRLSVNVKWSQCGVNKRLELNYHFLPNVVLESAAFLSGVLELVCDRMSPSRRWSWQEKTSTWLQSPL